MAEQQEKRPRQGEQGKSRQKSGPLEITATVVSVLLLLIAVGFLVWEGTRASRVPAFDFTFGEVRHTGERFFLPLRVRNTGTQSVEGLDFTVALVQGERTAAESSTTIPWLPAGSWREAVVGFQVDPRAYDVQVVVEGYSIP